MAQQQPVTYTPVIVHIQKEHECDMLACPDDCAKRIDVQHRAGTLSQQLAYSSTLPVWILGFTDVYFVVREARDDHERVDAVVGSHHFMFFEGPTRVRARVERFLTGDDSGEWAME